MNLAKFSNPKHTVTNFNSKFNNEKFKPMGNGSKFQA